MQLLYGFNKVQGFFSDPRTHYTYVILEDGHYRLLTREMWERYEVFLSA